MRKFTSIGIAIILVVIVGAWLSTGVFVRGGIGPEDGERTVAALIEPDGGPITDAIEASGMAKTEHHNEGADDPALTIAERSAVLAAENGETRSVRVESYTIRPMSLEVTLRGHTEATASLGAVAETSGLILTVEVEIGQMVEIGDLVCTIDRGTRQASVTQANAAIAQAEAGLAQAQTDFNTNLSLRESGLASVNSAETYQSALRAAQAGLETATAALTNANAELARTEVHAANAGIIQKPLAEVGDLAGPGTSCASIVQLDPMVFVGSIPQARIDLARLGMSAEIETINGQNASGEVTYISVSADESTRTFDVEIEFPNPNGKIYAGLTAEANVKMGTIPAHLIPQSVLTLDGDGVLGIRAVADEIVQFHEITILRDTREGIWVTGLPPKVEIIVLGQEYVKAGQTVNAGYVD